MTLLILLLAFIAPPEIFSATGRYAIPSTPDAAAAARPHPQTSGGAEPAASGVSSPDDWYVVVFTSRYCAPCQQMTRSTIPSLKAAGVAVRVVETDGPEYDGKWGVNVVPSTWIVDRKTRKKLRPPIIGYVSASRVLSAAKPQAVKYRPAVTVAGKSLVDRGEVITHLLSGDVHRGKFSREQLERMNDWELIDLHNLEHGVRTKNGVRQ